MKQTIEAPPNFSFWRTVYSHGWSSLPPFSVDKENGALRMVGRTSSGKVVGLTVREAGTGRLQIKGDNGELLSAGERRELSAIVRASFRLDENYDEFHAAASKTRGFRWVPRSGSGRLLRAPTVFEDVVKMICTTNCSWALTQTMVTRLCTHFGQRPGDGILAFPTPEAVADSSERFLRKNIRAGYRAPYLLEFARRVVKNEIDPEAWRTSTLATDELFEQVRSVKGVGLYAAGNVLKLLGRYDYLAIDSWCRKRFAILHRGGRKVSDRTIEKTYAQFGKWRGLFFWMDMTKHWQEEKYPF